MDAIEAKELAIQVPRLASDPKLQFLAERGLLPQQNDIDSFESPDNPLTAIRRGAGMYFPGEKRLIKQQNEALKEYDMEVKARKIADAELGKIMAMAPASLGQLFQRSPGAAEAIAPLERSMALDPKAVTAINENIGGINVADVINPAMLNRTENQLAQSGIGLMDRPLRQDERISAGNLLEKQAGGAIKLPGQAIQLPGEVSAITAANLRPKSKDETDQENRGQLIQRMEGLEDQLRGAGIDPNASPSSVPPQARVLLERYQAIQRDPLIAQRDKLKSAEQKPLIELVTPAVRDELLAKGLKDPTPGQINQAVRDHELTETGTQEVKGELAAMGVDPRNAKMKEWQRARKQVFERQLELVRQQGQVALENKPIDAQAQEVLSGLRGVQEQISNFKKKYTPKQLDQYLGLYDRPINEISQFLRADKGFADFSADLGALQATMFDIGGKNLTGIELKVLTKFTPDGWEPNATSFGSKLDTLLAKSALKEKEVTALVGAKRSDVGKGKASDKVKAAMKNLEDALANP